MKTNKMKIWIGCGILCVLSVLFSSWYAVAYNDSRLVVPMDFKDYVFDIKDLPMIVSISLVCVYLVALFVMLFIHAGKKQRQAVESGVTRKINPKLGCLGVLGFLGFAGFWTYPVDGTVFPFAFFLFFGFFGFYYEGKMSGTFMDERFRENIARAKLKAYRITFGVMLAALIILCQGKLFGNLEYTLIAAIIILSLALGLGIFLSEYLLYRYDHDDQAEEGEEYDMAEFECRLKKYRQMKDLTQEQLAEKVGVRRETIMRLEKAQYNPSLKLAIDISRAVEAPIEEIFVFK